jgi:hypothetical protein
MDSVVANAIFDLMTAEEHTEEVKDAIAYVMEGIQRYMIVAHLPKGLLEIMNMWARTGRWYDDDGDSKFEKCLWKVVSRELKKRVFDLLTEWMNEDNGKIPEKKDLYYALGTASNSLYYYHKNLWPTMGAELEAEACRWVLEHGELTLIESGDGGHFQYYDSINKEVCYHLPHLPKPNRFSKYEDEEEKFEYEEYEEEKAGWVCVGANTLVPC